MAKDKKARSIGYMSLGALGVVMGSMVDAMRYADLPNDVVHRFLNELEDGFILVLEDEALTIVLTLVQVLRNQVASND